MSDPETTPATTDATAAANTNEQERDEPRANSLMRRNFDGGVTMAHENSATQALIAKSTADSQARWIMAMRQPRDMHMVRQELKRECERPALAKKAVYSVPRGGNQIKGLSIRFAEVAMRCFGNMNCEAQTLYDSDEERVIRVCATDYESNSSWSRDITIKKTVERKSIAPGQRPIRVRTNSSGKPVYIVEATPDDVNMLEAAGISKAARTAILRLIPGHLQDEMRKICERVAETEAAKDPDAERNAMLDYFAGLGVMPEQLGEFLDHPIEQCTPVELVELRFLFAALRDGEADWGQVMEEKAKTRATLKARAKKHLDDQKAAAANKDTNAAKPAVDAKATEQPSTGTPAGATPPKDAKPAATSTGKGTSAAKDKLAKDKAATEAKTTKEPAPDIKPAPQDHAAPASSPKAGPQAESPSPFAVAPGELPPEQEPPAPGCEYRKCAGCQVITEVEIKAPDGARCYACRQGED